MALAYTATSANAMMDALGDLHDTDTNLAWLDFQDSVGGRVVACPFAADAFAASDAGTITANTIATGTCGEDTPDGSSTSAGTITTVKAIDGSTGSAILWTGTVTATGGGGDVELSSTTYAATEKLEITSLNLSMTVGA